jgi:hypothetical protein
MIINYCVEEKIVQDGFQTNRNSLSDLNSSRKYLYKQDAVNGRIFRPIVCDI